MIENMYACNKSPRVHEAKNGMENYHRQHGVIFYPPTPPKQIQKPLPWTQTHFHHSPLWIEGHAGYSGPAELHADGTPLTSGLLSSSENSFLKQKNLGILWLWVPRVLQALAHLCSFKVLCQELCSDTLRRRPSWLSFSSFLYLFAFSFSWYYFSKYSF